MLATVGKHDPSPSTRMRARGKKRSLETADPVRFRREVSGEERNENPPFFILGRG